MDELEQKREQNRWNPDRKEEKQEKPQSSMTEGTIMLMTVTALFFDALQIILIFFAVGVVADTFITIFAGLTFYVWFKMHGVSFTSPKRLLAIGGGWLIELIPFLNLIPTWTFAVWYTISTTKVLETVEKLPGGKVAGFAMQSKMAMTNASRAGAIANTTEGSKVQLRGGGTYAGTKKFESIDSMRNQPKLSPEQLKRRDATKAYTGWKTQMTDIDKMRGVKRKYADPEEKTTQDMSEDSEKQDMEQQKAA